LNLGKKRNSGDKPLSENLISQQKLFSPGKRRLLWIVLLALLVIPLVDILIYSGIIPIRLFSKIDPRAFSPRILIPETLKMPGRDQEPQIQKHFEGTNQEFSVYRLSGREKGPALLIIAGIHGDESGGYLTAERYLNLKLKKGTLIMVPRLNRPAIIAKKRFGLAGDMNRKFGQAEARNQNDPDLKVVNVVKQLIGQADYILNLHQGSGFYSPHWINSARNPLCWGQSNVIDMLVFDLPNGEKIEMEKIAENIARQANLDIRSASYYFKINNTNTASPDSLHKEQRKSLTYYALTDQHKVALGLEATKNCALPRAICFLTVAINAVMNEIGVIPEEFPSENSTRIAEELLNINNVSPSAP